MLALPTILQAYAKKQTETQGRGMGVVVSFFEIGQRSKANDRFNGERSSNNEASGIS